MNGKAAVVDMARGIAETMNRADARALLRDLGEQAYAHRFDIAPNPCVGAAILSAGRVIARGYHEVWGGAHAEVNAFEAAEASGVPQASWDTLVVTLEPCSSHGKTPPCVERVLASGIKCVVIGSLDPDPRHRGKAIELLESAGVEVMLVDGASSLQEVSPHFLNWMAYERLRRPRPWTIAKWAQTRTGQLTPPEDIGEGRWISCAESQAEVQVLRGRVDAIITGVGTVRADDPRLTVRSPGDPSNPPARVVLDSYLQTPPNAKLFQPQPEEHGAGEVHILCLPGVDGGRYNALEAAGAKISTLASNGNKQIALRDVQNWLWAQGYRRVMLEAGPTLLNRQFELGFVDEVRIYTGSVNGGRGESLGAILSELKLEGRVDRECGEDSVLEAFVQPR